MDEYIEREALMKVLKFRVEGQHQIYDTANMILSLVEDFVNEVPTADVVEVVRCCDCKHSQENLDINNTCYLTCNLKYGIRGTIDPTDFCSYGERKSD